MTDIANILLSVAMVVAPTLGYFDQVTKKKSFSYQVYPYIQRLGLSLKKRLV